MIAFSLPVVTALIACATHVFALPAGSELAPVPNAPLVSAPAAPRVVVVWARQSDSPDGSLNDDTAASTPVPAPQSTPSTSVTTSKESRLGMGAIIAVAVAGALGVFAFAAVAISLILVKRRKKQATARLSMDSQATLYDTDMWDNGDGSSKTKRASLLVHPGGRHSRSTSLGTPSEALVRSPLGAGFGFDRISSAPAKQHRAAVLAAPVDTAALRPLVLVPDRPAPRPPHSRSQSQTNPTKHRRMTSLEDAMAATSLLATAVSDASSDASSDRAPSPAPPASTVVPIRYTPGHRRSSSAPTVTVRAPPRPQRSLAREVATRNMLQRVQSQSHAARPVSANAASPVRNPAERRASVAAQQRLVLALGMDFPHQI